MKKTLLLLLLFCATICKAQIGYQVSLLNTATGEPRAFEKVKCEIEIKNSEKKTIHKETQTATSNDFGVISLSIGDEHTFDEMDWSKLPLFVSVSIDGRLIGESQILTVPVAEYAKKTGALTYENVSTKTVMSHSRNRDWYFEFNFTPNSHEVVCKMIDPGDFVRTCSGEYYIDGNSIYGYVSLEYDPGKEIFTAHYIPEIDTIIAYIDYEELR